MPSPQPPSDWLDDYLIEVDRAQRESVKPIGNYQMNWAEAALRRRNPNEETAVGKPIGASPKRKVRKHNKTYYRKDI